MNYEINIAKKDAKGIFTHLFATAERSLTTKRECREVLADLLKVYGDKDKYNVSVSLCQTTGKGISIDEMLNADDNGRIPQCLNLQGKNCTHPNINATCTHLDNNKMCVNSQF